MGNFENAYLLAIVVSSFVLISTMLFLDKKGYK